RGAAAGTTPRALASRRGCAAGRRGAARRVVVPAAVVVTAAGRRTHALAAAQHLHLVGADFRGVFLDAVLVGPLARAQAAFDIDLRALAQVFAGDFGEAAVEDHSVPLGGFLHLAALLVLPLVGGGDRDVGHAVAAGEGAHLGVAPQVADDDDL